ncbi:CLUMA_CG015080, isoform A [Clunio marinus]|uniref:CLUMA_CG015080, isoform A n=1 Tax=Clunio marinus TaxID=568069 RepID=A0A1J1ITU4_9DIPT|nr:CLUMA_CG015080, isoform A [Clunio marinus]
MRLIIFGVFLCLTQSSYGFFGYTRKYNNHEEPFLPHTNRILLINPKTIGEKWIEQRLDHFNPQDERKWMMRYFENDEHYIPNGPIFIYVGGEWSISAGSISAGSHIYDLAKEHNGILFYTEHRYYGKSHPTTNTSTENLRFLNIDQALADLAFFINHIKSRSSDLTNSRVIMVGGSYSATMVAWMRKKFPHLVTGSWASSAPLEALLDFYEYKEVMTNAIKLVGGDECAETFKNAFKEMEHLVEIGETRRLHLAFNLCSSLDLTQDIPHFFYELSDIVAGLVQGHRPGNIERACDYMKDQKETLDKDELDAFAAWIRKGSWTCLDMSYQNNVIKFTNIEWGSEANRQMRQWIYQTCSEFAWFQTSTSKNQIFGTTYPVDYFLKLCQDLYDNSFNLTTIEQNIARTNTFYGALKLSLTNVFFTHGGLDPWHPTGILEDLNESTPVVVLPLNAHVSDLGQISSYDSPELKATKEKIQELVRQWLNE